MVNGIFGIPCPSCGMTRAGLCLLRLDILSSLKMQPMLIPVVLLLSAAVFCTARKIPLSRLKYPALAVSVLLCAVYAVRMIIYFPHTEPMVFNGQSLLARLLSLF